MSDRFSFSFLCLLLAFIAAMPAAAQKPPQAPAPVAAAPSQEDQEPQPEPPKSVLNVEIKNDLLSVDLENVNFGAAIKVVADKAGFKIEGTGEVFSKKLNTRFTDIEVERGVLRLLTLVKESNYMLHYDTKGLISKLEILSVGSGRAPSVTARQPMRPTPAFRQPTVSSDLPPNLRPKTVRFPVTRRVRRPVPSQAISPPEPAAQPSGPATPQAAEEDDEKEESVDEIPYVAPQPRLAPAPVRKP